jgi:hypothetical protein
MVDTFVMDNSTSMDPGKLFTIPKELDLIAPFTSLNNTLIFNLVGLPEQFAQQIIFTDGIISMASILLKLDQLNYYQGVKQISYNIIPSYSNGHIKLDLYGNMQDVIIMASSAASTAISQLGLTEDILLSNTDAYAFTSTPYPVNLILYENLQIRLPSLLNSVESYDYTQESQFDLASVISLSGFKPFDLLTSSAGSQAIMLPCLKTHFSDIIIRIVTPDNYTPDLLYNTTSYPFYVILKYYYIPDNSAYI